MAQQPVNIGAAPNDGTGDPLRDAFDKLNDNDTELYAAAAAAQAHAALTNNPHAVTKTQVGLGNVDNVQQIPLTEKGAANGVATLDAGTKIPIAQLPDSVIGQVEYQGTWDAATNTPAIPAAATSNKGHYRVCSSSVAAGHGYPNVPNIAFDTGDWIISNGTVWEKVDNTDAVVSVFGRQGAVTANDADYTAAQVVVTPAGNISANRVQAALEELDAEKVHKTGNETIAGVKIFSSDPLIPDEAYGGSWDGSLEPPTKNAVYDKIEAMSAGSGLTHPQVMARAFFL